MGPRPSAAGQAEQIVIIGNGPAGNAAAAAIRRHDLRIRVHIFSEEPFPFYSPCFLHEHLSGELKREALFIKKMEDYRRHGIEITLDRAIIEIDLEKKRVLHAAGEKIFSKLILGTGGRPILQKLPGDHLAGIFTFKTPADSEAISKYCDMHGVRSACVVGAGPIGLETAHSLLTRGMEVVLIVRGNSILSRLFSEKMAGRIQELLEARGLRILTGTQLLEISGEDRVRSVQFSDKKRFDCGMVLFGMGVKPNTDLAGRAGMTLGTSGGIPVDAHMRSSVPDVYACGDCAETYDPFLEEHRIAALWPNAVLGGKTAGLNCLGIIKPLPSLVDFTRINLPGMNAVSLGYSEKMLKNAVNIDKIEGSVQGAEYLLILSDGNLIGAQILGVNPFPMIWSLIYKKEKLAGLKKIGSPVQLSLLNPLSCLVRYRWPMLPGTAGQPIEASAK